MKNIYYKDDFICDMCISDCKGDEIKMPECDWEMRFWTKQKPNAYIAKCVSGTLINCKIDDNGKLTVIFDNHHMGIGNISYELIIHYPDERFPDGERRICAKGRLDITLTNDNTCQYSICSAEIQLPVIGIDLSDYATKEDLREAINGIFSYDPDTRTLNITTDDSD